MTACERASTLFGRAWDDELTAAERDGLERHFTACTPCRREYDELARTLELVQALPRPAVDDAFATRVLATARAREEEAAAASLGRRLFALPAAWSLPSFGRPALALAATLVVAIGVGAFVMSRPVIAPTPVATAPQVQAPVDATAPTATPAREVTVATVPTSPSPVAPSRVAPRRAANTALAATAVPTIADSLFDHSADVELVLDPVQLRRERGRGYAPSSSTERGEAASITF